MHAYTHSHNIDTHITGTFSCQPMEEATQTAIITINTDTEKKYQQQTVTAAIEKKDMRFRTLRGFWFPVLLETRHRSVHTLI